MITFSLKPCSVVDFAEGGRVGQDAGRLLEGSRGDERLGLQRGLGDAEEDRLRSFGRLARLFDAPVVVDERGAVRPARPRKCACRRAR
jgi:hypothetical protein